MNSTLSPMHSFQVRKRQTSPLASSRCDSEFSIIMSATTPLSKVGFPIVFSAVLLLFGCQSSTPPEFGMVDWYIANGGGSSITLTVYDKVCGRNYYRVRVARASETPISTCANEAGDVEIRFSRTAGYSVSANPVRHDVVSSNQSLLVD